MVSHQGRPEPAAPRCRLLVAAPRGWRREALLTALATLPAVEVVGSADTGADAVIEAWRLQPDLVMFDATLAGQGLAGAVRHLLRATPGLTVCLLAETEFSAGISAGLDAGAAECLTHQRAHDREWLALVLRRLCRRHRPRRQTAQRPPTPR